MLTPEIFDALKNITELRNGELYMSDALDNMAKEGKVIACEFEGKRYDIGNKEGYLEATIEYALRDRNLKEEFSEYLNNLKV